MKESLTILTIFLIIKETIGQSTDMCYGVTQNNVEIFSLVYELFNLTRNNSLMAEWAQGTQPFPTYIVSTFGWAIFFGTLAFICLIIFIVSLISVACPKCCRKCQKDLSRSDYQKSEKMVPFIVFVIFSVFSLIACSYGIYQTHELTKANSQSLCRVSQFQEQVYYGSTNWKGFNGLSREYSQFQDIINQTFQDYSDIFEDKSNSWIQTSNKDLDQIIAFIEEEFTDFNVSNFDGSLSTFTILSNNTLSPTIKEGTTLNLISKNKNVTIGQKLDSLQQLKTQYQQFAYLGTRFTISDLQRIEIDTKELSELIVEGLNYGKKVSLGTTIALYASFSLAILGVLLSIIIFVFAIKSQNRKLKCLSNIGWISASISLIFILSLATFMAFVGPILFDFCKITDEGISEENMNKYPNLIPPSLYKTVQQCLFTEDKDLSNLYSVDEEISYLENLKNKSTSFLNQAYQSQSSELNQQVFALTQKIQSPSELQFDTQKQIVTQPLQKLNQLNQVSNKEKVTGFLLACENAEDVFTDGTCPPGFPLITPSQAPTSNLGLKTCMKVQDLDMTFVRQRYSGSEDQNCLSLYTYFDEYKKFEIEVSKELGVLPRLRAQYENLQSEETLAIQKVKDIEPKILIATNNLQQNFDQQDKANYETVQNKFNCGIFLPLYEDFKQPVCQASVPGMIEIMFIAFVVTIFNIVNTLFGVCFVLRNKLDVPLIKLEKEYEKNFNANAQQKAIKDNLLRYHKMRKSPKKSKEKNLNLSSVNDTAFLENSNYFSKQ